MVVDEVLDNKLLLEVFLLLLNLSTAPAELLAFSRAEWHVSAIFAPGRDFVRVAVVAALRFLLLLTNIAAKYVRQVLSSCSFQQDL